jgi:type II secretory pathway pseudopilin PulG
LGRVRRLARDQRGESLIELMIALTFLAVALAALLSLLVSSNLSQQRAQRKGSAVALANARMELYRGIPYRSIRLAASTIPSVSDPYATASASDASIPSASGQVVGGAGGETACGSPTPPECAATQTVTGADGRTYRVDTYVRAVATPAGGTVKQVTVVVRQVVNGTVGPILGRVMSAFDASSL